MNLTPEETDLLVDRLRRQLLYQTATRVYEGLEVTRVNVAIQWPAYCTIMELINKAGGFEPPKEARQALLQIHADKARSVGDGSYDLKDWSAGELVMAIQEAREVPQLDEFAKACTEEMRRRAV